MSYVVPIHRPSGVRHALKLNFLRPDQDALIVAKANRIEVYEYGTDGLTHVHTRSVYGYITMLEHLRPAAAQTDHLFVGTDRYQYFTCSWDPATKQIKTEQSFVDQSDKVLRDSREQDRCHFDPTRRFMTLELYDGMITVIPVEQGSGKRGSKSDVGTLLPPLQVRVEELLTRSSAYVQTEPTSMDNPRMAILWEDNLDIPQLKVRELKYHFSPDQSTADLDTVAEFRQDLDLGASHLIPITAPYGGFLVLGEKSILYASSDLQHSFSKPLNDQATLWSCWTKVDDRRYLLGDDYGRLYFLMIETDFQSVVSWKLDYLGITSRASCLVYLDEGFAFVGSFSGDSQVVQIVPGAVTVVQTFSNIAPILDFSIMDLGRGAESNAASDFSSGQARIVAACGAWDNGTIRSVRSGVGMEEIGLLAEISHITELWGLSASGAENEHEILVVSFMDETKVLLFDGEQVEELEDFHNFELSQPTLLANNLPDRRAVQVTEASLRIVDLESSMLLMEWRPPDAGARITAAAANSVHLLVVEGGHTLHIFHPANSEPKPTISKTFPADSQISAVTVPDSQTNICLVSFWQSASVAILDLHSLETLSTQTLGSPGTDIPRSVLVAHVLPNALPTLFIAMADGTVVTFSFDASTNTLSNMNRILLGTEPVFFKVLPRDSDTESGLSNVFASCEQPSLIYSSEGRIVYSAVNADKSSRVCYFNSTAFPGSIAVATPDRLNLATIGKERTTQIQTLPVGQTVRCLAYEPKAALFAMGCIRREVDSSNNEILYSSVKIADEVSFKEVDSVELEDGEMVECIVTTGHFDSDDGEEYGDMFIVGTSILKDEDARVDERAAMGRILVFEVNKERHLKQVTELEVKGACRSLAMCEGKVVAGLVKVVVLYGLAPATSRGRHTLELKKLATTRVSTNPLSLAVTPSTPSSPPIIAVADLMKSLTIIELHPPSKSNNDYSLREVSRHFDTLWSSSTAAIGNNEWLVADMDGNLKVLKRNLEGVTADDRKKLQTTGEFRLGEVVNKIVPIFTPGAEPTVSGKGKERARTTSSAARPHGQQAVRSGPIITPKAFLATIEGAIYMHGSINPAYQDVLLRLQSGLASKVQAPGYMPWAKFRAWKTDVKEESEPFRFVDGEMVEQGLLKLSDDDLTTVLRESGLMDETLNVSLEEVRRWGEELRRLY